MSVRRLIYSGDNVRPSDNARSSDGSLSCSDSCGDARAGPGRGKCDVAAYHPSNGSLWVGQNLGDRFGLDIRAATMAPDAGWVFASGLFTSDSVSDLVVYQPSDGSVWVGKSDCLGVEGYCWPISGAPGDVIDFKVSGEGSSSFVFMRHVADSLGVHSERQSTARTSYSVRRRCRRSPGGTAVAGRPASRGRSRPRPVRASTR